MSISPIEKNKLENIDLLQIEYFSDLTISQKDIIVIEPSDPIAITIRKFLTNLNFKNIYVCKNPNEGIKIFADFVGNEISVPIIIDDNQPNQKITDIVKDILEMQPSANIVIITTKEKTDPHITKLFDIGISSITQKPLKETELEKSLFGTIKEKNNKKESTNEDKFDTLLSSSSIISKNRVKSITDANELEIESWFEKAKENQKIILDKEILEATCNQCKSSNITYSSKCPSCKQINIKQEILVEHYSCGEVYVKEVGSNICPKCNKNIGLVGKDYRENTDYYVCKSCNDKFPRPFFELICLKCANVFVEGTIQWEKNTIYKVRK